MEHNTENNWAIFTQYPTMLISHGQFIFSKDKAMSFAKIIKIKNKYTMWIQNEKTNDRINVS